MDIKEIAKGMTRNEFLNSIDKNGRLKYEDKAINCPGNLKLKELGEKCNIRKCQECWEQAIKDIKFKGEDTVKELTFKEVIANIKEGEKWICTKDHYSIKSISLNSGYIDMEYSNGVRYGINIHPDAKFIKEQQPVTFEEILSSNKNCRVEHKLINTNEPISNVSNITESEWKAYCNGEYIRFGTLMSILGYKYTFELEEIIKNGKWYIEE